GIPMAETRAAARTKQGTAGSRLVATPAAHCLRQRPVLHPQSRALWATWPNPTGEVPSAAPPGEGRGCHPRARREAHEKGQAVVVKTSGQCNGFENSPCNGYQEQPM